MRLFLPHSTRFIPLPHHTPVLQLARSMAPWKLRLEARAREIANGDNAKLEKLMEIISWFAEERDLKEAMRMAFRRLTEAEDLAPHADGRARGCAQDVALGDGGVGVRRPQAGDEVEGVSIPPPQACGSDGVRRWSSDGLGGAGSHDGGGEGVEGPVGVKPGARRKKARWPMVIRRSPHFPRRSPRLLSLAHACGNRRLAGG